ncbi:MAG: sulfite exporter TauE/SafE family protein [Acidobacteria bacterium]|nr:sulfite exporter TauE/SafE family protein [Acidobacteriota bacterium]
MNLSSFSLHSAVLLFFAALLGGTLNAVAGGGSFIAFPSLIFTGVPAVPANATNTVAMWCGLVFSGGAFRHHLKVQPSVLISLTAASIAGGMLGALLLLRTPGETFLRVLPWLMLFAVLLFIFGPYLTQGDRRTASKSGVRRILGAVFFQLLVAIYGGYFGGGMGFVILAMLTVFGMADIHEMNAFKTVLSSATNGVAVLIFILRHAVYWPQAAVMICGAALGGYFGAHYSLRLPRFWVRWFVIAVGAGMTTYFFARAY